MTLDNWRQLIEPTATEIQVPYFDLARSVASYNAGLGGAKIGREFN